MRGAQIRAAELGIEEKVNEVNMLWEQLPLEGKAGRNTTSVRNKINSSMWVVSKEGLLWCLCMALARDLHWHCLLHI